MCKPSHLGLELAKDKHASKGMDETDLMDGFEETNHRTSTFDETWKPVWGETATPLGEVPVCAAAPMGRRAMARSRMSLRVMMMVFYLLFRCRPACVMSSLIVLL